MPSGILALLVVAAVVFFGLAHRALDRLRLTDGQALLLIGLIIAGSFVDLPIARAPVQVSVNVGGALIPLALGIYLVAKADTATERVRSVVGAIITGAIILAIASLTDFGPEGQAGFVDPVWLFSAIAGVTGYVVGGRSRRAAFVSGTLGVLLTDVVQLARVLRLGQAATVMIGGAGAFDMVVLAGIIAVGLAELIGETRERLSGGPGPGATRSLALMAGTGALAALLAVQGQAWAAFPGAGEWGERVDDRYFTLVGDAGRVVTHTALLLGQGDVYIDAQNRRWVVESIRGDTVHVKLAGVEAMPSVASIEATGGRAGAAAGGRNAAGGGLDVAIYFTHSDESYVPTSGTPAKWWGDIYQVGGTLGSTLRQMGYRVQVSGANHNPHDGQAYLRSRRTAVQLMRSRPALLVDVHRDAVPPEVYSATVKGRTVTKVRLVVGRQNQNMQANLAFAKRIKAVADQRLPGIIEGIFMAKGNYNQDLMARAILLEFGAHTNPLDRAEAAARLFAAILPPAGGVGPAGGGAGRQIGSGAWRGVIALATALILGAGAYIVLNAGNVDELRGRIAGWWRQTVGGTPLGSRAGGQGIQGMKAEAGQDDRKGGPGDRG